MMLSSRPRLRAVLRCLGVLATMAVAAAAVVGPSGSAGSNLPVAAPAQPPAATTWYTSSGHLVVAGIDRTYVMSRPPADAASTARLPVLIELHGCCVSTAMEQARSGFVGVTGPAIVVYATGVDQTWNAGTCCGSAQSKGVDDVGFIAALVHDILVSQPDADPRAVFLAGYSNGGKMALRMACERPDLFAAVATYGAVNAMACATPAPVSLLELVGAHDPETTIGPGGQGPVVNGYRTPTVTEQVALYRRADGCGQPVTKRTDGTLTTTTWTGCDPGRCVALGVFASADHIWPVGDGATPSGASAMWAFFRAASRCST